MGLLERGVESRFCAVYPSVGLPQSFSPALTRLDRLIRAARLRRDAQLIREYSPDNDYVLSTGMVGFDIAEIVASEKPDVLHLHWIAGNTFDIRTLRGIRVPVVWRLSDMWPFCGVEHLQPDANRYTAPVVARGNSQSPRLDLSERVRREKAAAYREVAQLTVTCPSRWMEAEARRSALLGQRPIELIPTSCDTDLFRSIDQTACRLVLGLPQDERIVLVGATSMGTQWKGLDLFVQAMLKVAETQTLKVVVFGKDGAAADELAGRMEVQYIGQVRDRRLMSILYNAADVCVAPSRMENLANTVLESLACGTPVVAFDIGGMPDMIDHQVNGFLATPFDVRSLAAGIEWGLNERANPMVSRAARQKVLDIFSLSQEVEKYVDLYRRMQESHA